MRNRLRSFAAIAVFALAASLLAPSAIVGAAAQTADDIELRDQLISDQEALLNVYRCMFDIDTEIVPGGCTNGMPTHEAAGPQPFAGTPSAADISLRDRLVQAQEALLNAYRCLFNVDTEIVPGGCADDMSEGEPDGEPAVMMVDFPIDEATTGDELLAITSETESACIKMLFGDEGFDRFGGTPIVEAAAIDGTYKVFADCLEFDNLLAVAVGLVSNTGGGWEQNSRECATAVAMDYPELVYYAFGLTDRITEADASVQAQVDLLRFYRCLTAEEKVAFNVVILSEPVTTFSGSDLLNIVSDAEVECMQTSMSESDYETVVNAADLFTDGSEAVSPELQFQVAACLSAETIVVIPNELIVTNLGISAETSRACVLGVLEENPDYVTLIVQVSDRAEALTHEEFVALSDNALELFSCLNQDEIQFFIENYLPLIVP